MIIELFIKFILFYSWKFVQFLKLLSEKKAKWLKIQNKTHKKICVPGTK